MKKPGVLAYVLSAILTFVLLASFAGMPAVTAAADPTPTPTPTPTPAPEPPESVTLSTRFPVIKGKGNASFEFEVEIKYTGKDAKVFALAGKGPSNFNLEIRPQFDTKEVSAIRIDPSKSFGESIKLVASPFSWDLPAPGTYPFTFAVSSGNLKADIELKAEVTSNLKLSMETATGRLNTDATAGGENRFSISVKNTGTEELKNVTLSAYKPDSNWNVTFSSDKIDTLPVNGKKDVDVIIKPSGKAIAGDYTVTLNVQDDSGTARGSLEIRTTVLTSTLWGWVGVAIVLLVIGGMVYLFMRLGRR